MKFKALAIILLLTVSAFAGTFKSTEGRFSANFIASPTVTTRVIKTAKDTDVSITNFFAMNEKRTLGEDIDYTDFPEPLTAEQLRETAEAAFSDSVLSSIGTGEYVGHTWTLAAGHDDLLLYFYASTCVGTRLYEVTIAAPIKDATPETEAFAEAFLKSVVITNVTEK